MNKRTMTQANFSPLNNNDKKKKLIDDIAKVGELTGRVLENPETPDYAKAIIQQLSAVLSATADLMQSQQQQLAMDPHELERQRSVVLIGIPESTKARATERAKDDLETVTEVLDLLDVEAMPQTVYRMGRPDPDRRGGRLIKVVLPARTFQWRVLGQWKRRRDTIKRDKFSRLLIRPSLTPEMLREERQRRDQRRTDQHIDHTYDHSQQKNI